MKLIIKVEYGCTASIMLTGKTEDEVFKKLCQHPDVINTQKEIDLHKKPEWPPGWQGKFTDLSNLLKLYQEWWVDDIHFLELVDLDLEKLEQDKNV